MAWQCITPDVLISAVDETDDDTLYRSADKSLAQPWKETSYSDQDLQHYTKTYGLQTTGIYSCCLYAISLGIVL